MAAGATLGYDGNGHLSSDGTWTYVYDANDRLRSASKTGFSGTLVYDGTDRLRRTVLGGVTTNLMYDGANLVAEYDGSNALLRRYVHGPGIDEPLVWYEGSGTTNKTWLYADNLGSIAATADGAGASTATYSYGSYGEPNVTTGIRFRYTGQQYEKIRFLRAISMPRDLFNLAKACIENEDMGQAKDLIEQAIALGPANEYIVSQAVDKFGAAQLYSSAKKAVENYQRLTGLKLPLEFTYEDIVEHERRNALVDDVPVFDLAAGPLRFVRLSDLQRGSLSSFVTTDVPVEEIEVSEQGISIIQAGIKYRYKWEVIIRASIVARMIFKGMGYIGGYFSQKICTLEAPGKRFQFDISSTFPDFRETVLIPAVLRRYLNVEFINERKPGFKAAKDDPIRNLKRREHIRTGMVVGGIILFILYLYVNEPH